MQDGFTPGTILKTLFLYTEENARFFARHKIYCDESLVYKWMRDDVPLPKQHIQAIVDFATEQISDTNRKEFRGKAELSLRQSPIGNQVKEAIVATEDFNEFLRLVLENSIALRKAAKLQKKKRDDIDGVPVSRTKTLTRLIVCALLAPLAGGAIWASVNRLLGLQYYMGGSGNEPTGGFSILWGVIAGAPIICFALLAAFPGEVKDFPTPPKRFILIVLYSLLEGIGAFVFYNSGFRAAIEGLHFAYGAQELIIAFVYALLLSSLPVLALFTLRPRIRIRWRFILVGILVCAVAASLTALGTWMIGRPEAEVSQLRGFAVALALRLCMFAMVYILLRQLNTGHFGGYFGILPRCKASP